jgi:hypothetical protein
MLHVAAAAVERFAHELAAPDHADTLVDIRARSGRMDRVVDEVIEHFGPKPGVDTAQRKRNLQTVDGLIALVSSSIEELAAKLDQMNPGGPLFDAAVEAHDHTVGVYYRLMALRSDLDPETRPGPEAPALDNPEAVSAWADRLFAKADAQG